MDALKIYWHIVVFLQEQVFELPLEMSSYKIFLMNTGAAQTPQAKPPFLPSSVLLQT